MRILLKNLAYRKGIVYLGYQEHHQKSPHTSFQMVNPAPVQETATPKRLQRSFPRCRAVVTDARVAVRTLDCAAVAANSLSLVSRQLPRRDSTAVIFLAVLITYMPTQSLQALQFLESQIPELMVPSEVLQSFFLSYSNLHSCIGNATADIQRDVNILQLHFTSFLLLKELSTYTITLVSINSWY